MLLNQLILKGAIDWWGFFILLVIIIVANLIRKRVR